MEFGYNKIKAGPFVFTRNVQYGTLQGKFFGRWYNLPKGFGLYYLWGAFDLAEPEIESLRGVNRIIYNLIHKRSNP